MYAVRSWRRWTHRKSTRKDSMRKKWYFPKKKENLFFQSQMDESNLLEEIRTWEHPPWYGIDQFMEKQPQDSFPDAGEAINDFWSMLGNFIYRHHVEPRVKLYSPRKESFPFPLRYIDVSRTTHTKFGCQAGETHRWLLKHWWLSRLVWSLDRFHTIYSIGEKAPDGYMWSGERLTRNNLHPGQIIYDQSSGSQWESTPSWRRSKSGLMKSSIWRTHENWEGSISLTRSIRNSKKPSRMPVRSWKRQLLLLCPAKLWRIVGVADLTKIRQNLSVFWKLMDLRDCVWEIHYQIIMKTILQEKETIHYSIIIWFTNLFLCLKLWKFQQQRQQWTRNWKNWRNFRRGTWRKSRVRNKWSMKQGRRGATVHFASLMDMSSGKCWIGGKAPKIQRSNCTPRWYCKR